MPWCPKCGAEFREGFTTCNSCHVPLIDHEPDGTEEVPPEPQYGEKWLQNDKKRALTLTALRALIILFLAAAVLLLIADKGIF